MAEKVIKVENVYKDFKLVHEKNTTIKSRFVGLLKGKKNRTSEKQHALKNISFEIEQGEFFGIVGRNGSGKSTLLKILAEIYQPTKGSVTVKGKLVPFIELGVGFNPELTGRENVYLNGAILGFSKKEVDAFYSEVVEFAELEEFMDKKLKNYSSGMQVRLAFAMAIRAKADILLIDEVLAVGDANFQRKCYEYFQRVKADGTTVVFVTHDMGAVRQYCDRVAVIDDSRLLSVGEAEAAAKKYVRLFDEGTQNKGEQQVKKNRWGNKKAIFENVTTRIVDGGKSVMVTAEVKVKEDVLDPTYGFMVANEASQPILGTNSNIERIKVSPLKAGQKKTLTWKFPNIFNEGRFYIELVLMYSSVTQVADWWENASLFTIKNDKRTPYLANPETKFSIE